LILEGWRDAVWSGRYHAVRYDCTSQSVATWIARLARKIGLTDSQFTAKVQTTAEHIAALSPAVVPADAAPTTPPLSTEAKPANDQPGHPAPAGEPTSHEAPEPSTDDSTPLQEPDTADVLAERDRMYRDVFGMDEAPRRRWRRQR